ncbi:hypothetical protein HPP92_026933 [Vanilla planifolia]|uniref:Uncharacterized protein n=1 Tax=Vanilla planifolia TaxID=51239 RepID=A0A835PBQ1_VANPL|nr:hypothetical protein HPP92_027079 [Vanilla planifolia]KAG0450109.1 hypothetical protein HPP92_026933 [Vanilla planifolia]
MAVSNGLANGKRVLVEGQCVAQRRLPTGNQGPLGQWQFDVKKGNFKGAGNGWSFERVIKRRNRAPLSQSNGSLAGYCRCLVWMGLQPSRLMRLLVILSRKAIHPEVEGSII